jgi:hypothetical protein
MELIPFAGQNVVFAENQPEYLPMPAHRILRSPEGEIVCCWKLTWRERWQVLTGGRVWHRIMTFGQPLQPQLLQTWEPPEVVFAREDEERGGAQHLHR